MAYAQELKNLVAEIKTSHKNRTNYLDDLKGDTADLLARYDKEMKELAADLKEFLKKSEATRIADFKAMMQDIRGDIGAIKKSVADLLGSYTAERKEAARYWASLRGGEVVAPLPVARAERRRGRRKK